MTWGEESVPTTALRSIESESHVSHSRQPPMAGVLHPSMLHSYQNPGKVAIISSEDEEEPLRDCLRCVDDTHALFHFLFPIVVLPN